MNRQSNLEDALEQLDNDVIVTDKGIVADKKQIARAYSFLSSLLENKQVTKFRVRKVLRLLSGKHKAFKTASALKAKLLLREWVNANKGVIV